MFREFDVLRQSIALYFFLLSIKFINKNFIKFLLINIFGAFFHISALIFIPLYFIFKLKFGRNFILVILVLQFATFFSNFSLVSYILERLSVFFPELTLVQKLYMNATTLENQGSFSFVGVLYAVYLLILYINYNKIDYSNIKTRFFINAFFIFIIINIFFSDSKEIADRLSYYFYFGLAYLFVFSIKFIPKGLYFSYLALILILPIIRFSRVIANPSTKTVLVPYRNYFFVNPNDDESILINWKDKNEE
jgi:hypothetical protein